VNLTAALVPAAGEHQENSIRIRAGALTRICAQGGNIMTRRITLMLTGTALLGLAVAALPQIGFAQSDPFLGAWQLNVAKSKFSPGPAPKSQTVNIQAEGQNHKVTFTGIDAAGNPTSAVFTRIYGGMPHLGGGPGSDAVSLTRTDAYTIIISRTKAGKLVSTTTAVVSQDGKTMTGMTTGTDANGRPFNVITVHDKQ
jgi:hypothetical protein